MRGEARALTLRFGQAELIHTVNSAYQLGTQLTIHVKIRMNEEKEEKTRLTTDFNVIGA